jgi:hypothetical protein
MSGVCMSLTASNGSNPSILLAGSGGSMQNRHTIGFKLERSFSMKRLPND